MIFKVVTLLAIAVAVNGGLVPTSYDHYPSYASVLPVPQPAVVKHAAAPAPVHKHMEYDTPAKYDFSYGVHDPHSGDIKGQKESRKGHNVHGFYSLIDADGYKRTVEYTADEHNGFNAVVYREPLGHPSPTPTPAMPYKTVAAPVPVYKVAPAQAPVYKVSPTPSSLHKEPSTPAETSILEHTPVAAPVFHYPAAPTPKTSDKYALNSVAVYKAHPVTDSAPNYASAYHGPAAQSLPVPALARSPISATKHVPAPAAHYELNNQYQFSSGHLFTRGPVHDRIEAAPTKYTLSNAEPLHLSPYYEDIHYAAPHKTHH